MGICLRIVRRYAANRLLFGRRKLHLHRACDICCDVRFNLENINQLTIVRFRPKMSAGSSVNELRCNSHTIARVPDAALHDGTDVKFARDVLNLLVC